MLLNIHLDLNNDEIQSLTNTTEMVNFPLMGPKLLLLFKDQVESLGPVINTKLTGGLLLSMVVTGNSMCFKLPTPHTQATYWIMTVPGKVMSFIASNCRFIIFQESLLLHLKHWDSQVIMHAIAHAVLISIYWSALGSIIGIMATELVVNWWW